MPGRSSSRPGSPGTTDRSFSGSYALTPSLSRKNCGHDQPPAVFQPFVCRVRQGDPIVLAAPIHVRKRLGRHSSTVTSGFTILRRGGNCLRCSGVPAPTKQLKNASRSFSSCTVMYGQSRAAEIGANKSPVPAGNRSSKILSRSTTRLRSGSRGAIRSGGTGTSYSMAISRVAFRPRPSCCCWSADAMDPAVGLGQDNRPLKPWVSRRCARW